MAETKILTTEVEIEGIKEAWQRLYAGCGKSPFVDYDFFMIWWRNVGKVDGKSLHVVSVVDGGDLVAVLPLTTVKMKGMRVLQAAGYRAYNYADMLASSASFAASAWQAAKQSRHYDFADIRDVYPESQCYAALSQFACKRDESKAFAIRLEWPSGDAWKASLPKAMRTNLKRCIKRLEEQGPLSFEVYKSGHLPTEVTTPMIEQKVAWSKANNMPGLFNHLGVRTYYHDVMQDALERGTLFLAWLKCGDAIIAYNQGFIHENTLHMPFWTYNPDWGKYSPGTVILSNTICHAIAMGWKAIDMRQGESQIKRKHANETRHCAEFTFQGSLRGWVAEKSYMGLREVVRRLRQIRQGSDAIAEGNVE